jgi:hypothetical protein
LLVAVPGQNTFDVFDLRAEEPVAKPLPVPDDILAAGSTTTGWQVVEWAGDNRRVLLRRSYDSPAKPGSEYILLDREDPQASQNLSVEFGFNPDKIELRERKYDQYYLHDKGNGQLFTASLERPTPQPHISDVLDFTTDKDVVAYVTVKDAPKGKALVRVQKGADRPLDVRQLPAGSPYVLDAAVYDDTLYLAAGAARDNRVFLYGDPIGKLKSRSVDPLVPEQILKVANPKRASFSPNGRFAAAESGDKFAIYDVETERGHVYETGMPMDKPQSHAVWADGFRLMYVSEGRVVVFDFDGTNLHKLSPASPNRLPALDSDRRFLYSMDSSHALTRTSMLTEEDL